MQSKPKEQQAADATAFVHIPHTLIASSADHTGNGTEESPYIVSWDPDDPDDPYNWSRTYKWFITVQLALGTMCVTFASSSYTGSLAQTKVRWRMISPWAE